MLSKRSLTFLVCLLLLIFISGCAKDKLSMIVPSGSTQFAQLYLENSDDYETTVVQGADPLVSAFAANSYDIIVAPTNLGAKLYQSKPTYQLAASITWGNYYLVSKRVIISDDLEHQEIIAFGQNQTPDAILQYVLEEQVVNITYLDSIASVVSEFILDGSKIYLVAEPSLSILKATFDLSVVDIQSLYQQKTGKDSYPQASVFVHHTLSNREVKKIKDDFKNSIHLANEDPTSASVVAIELGIHIDQDVIVSAIDHSNIMYMSSEDAKSDIVYYLEMLRNFNVVFTGEELPDDSFYR